MEVDPRLRELLQREADRAVLPDRLHREVLRRAGIRRRITAFVTAGALVALSVGGVAGIQGLQSLLERRPVGPGSRAPVGPDMGDEVFPMHPAPVGARVVVAEGTEAGQNWALIAYESREGLCVDLQVGQGRGGGCGWGVPEKNDLGLSEGSQLGVPGTIIHGVLSKRVSSLEARFESGGQVPMTKSVLLEIIDGPAGFDVNFFVAFLPGKARGVILAKDSKGAVLQSQLLVLAGQQRQEPFTEEVIDRHKITIYFLEGWQRAESQLAPTPAADEILALGTNYLRAGADECPEIPETALEDMRPIDAFVYLQESSSGLGFPRSRPAKFSAELGEEPEWVSCLANRSTLSVRVVRFSDGGRFFSALVAWGSSAPKERLVEAWEILDNLLVCDTSSPPGDCL
jgi:hypothetical protein